MRQKVKHIHFVGVGGIGMSGIAEVLLNLGYIISGSDLAQSEATRRLEKLGARIHVPHRAENVGNAEVVVTSTAIRDDNPEVLIAQAKGIPVIPRAEMLAELLKMKFSIAVSGSHGKTTTTSMIATVLAHGGLDPTMVIGGKLSSIGSNAKIGAGGIIVAEADESDRSFLKLSPTIAAITNIDLEHIDHYRDIEDIKDAFVDFANRVPFYGATILFVGDANVEAIIPRLKRRLITCGLSAKNDYWAADIKEEGYGSSFCLYKGEKSLGVVSLKVPGRFNVKNALVTIACALELGMSIDELRVAIQDFSGVQRRLEVKGEVRGITVVDDYGHHPTEIWETLHAARGAWRTGRIVTVFQPHRYTRTQGLFSEFIHCFDAADEVVMLDIYPASESPIAGVTSSALCAAMQSAGYAQVQYMADVEKIVQHLRQTLGAGDVLITQGAGDVYKIGEKLLQLLREG
ncbi:MAG: UDP-N-acetylmuramate--L-alanine ligase [Deltaproteobacteria bacterium]|nr:UDP-N-acetylmuramate--L-alanine ligase [Deltaproteobacteria bacterium]